MKSDVPIKVAFLTPEYPHERITGYIGGIATSVFNLANEMIKEGISVSVIVYEQEKDETFEDNGIVFYRIKNSDRRKLTWFHNQRKIEKLINALIDQKKVNIIEAPDWRGTTAFIRAKCPIVVKLHGSDTYSAFNSKHKIYWLTRYLEKRALLKADALVGVSRFAADMVTKIFKLRREFEIIHNGVDIRKFQPTLKKERPEKIILYFGTLARKKGSLELAHIFNLVIETEPDAKLWLVGLNSDDPTTRSSSVWKMMQETFSEAAGRNAKYWGNVSYSEIKNFIDDASICVFPSFGEALPVSWIEAMAMGKAIVASDIGCAKELIEEGKEGFLVNPTNHPLFAKRIVEILHDNDLRHAVGAAAKTKAARQFSTHEIAKQNISLYSQILSKKKK